MLGDPPARVAAIGSEVATYLVADDLRPPLRWGHGSLEVAAIARHDPGGHGEVEEVMHRDLGNFRELDLGCGEVLSCWRSR